LQFKTDFWTSYAEDIGFILSDEAIPTWWTQSPVQGKLLTGWHGGPKAATLSLLSK
jgi:monoamine oxidase